jgi:hypothetical protein
VVGASHSYVLSNAQAVGTTGNDFIYWIHTRWVDPTNPTNPALWRWSRAVPVTYNALGQVVSWDGVMSCALPTPLTPTDVNTFGMCPATGFTVNTNTGTINGFSQFAQSYNLTVGGINGNPYPTATFSGISMPRTISTLPWGEYSFTLRGVNQYKGTTQIGDSFTDTFECPPPDPVLTLTAQDQLVRRGTETQLNWTIQANYEVDCELTGGGLTTDINRVGVPSANPADYTFTGTLGTGPITNTTNFTLTCTPNVSTYPGLPSRSTTIRVEVVPQGQEV